METNKSKPMDPLSINGGPMTRVRAKRMKEALNGLVQDIWARVLHNMTCTPSREHQSFKILFKLKNKPKNINLEAWVSIIMQLGCYLFN